MDWSWRLSLRGKPIWCIASMSHCGVNPLPSQRRRRHHPPNGKTSMDGGGTLPPSLPCYPLLSKVRRVWIVLRPAAAVAVATLRQGPRRSGLRDWRPAVRPRVASMWLAFRNLHRSLFGKIRICTCRVDARWPLLKPRSRQRCLPRCRTFRMATAWQSMSNRALLPLGWTYVTKLSSECQAISVMGHFVNSSANFSSAYIFRSILDGDCARFGIQHDRSILQAKESLANVLAHPTAPHSWR